MKTRKTFLFDEKKEAEEIILSGFPNGVLDYSKMYIIAKYFRETFNYGEIRLERELIRFCKEHDKNFNPVLEAEIIKKWVRSAMNYNLRKIDSVTISEKELNTLSEIEKEKDRKILFVALVLSKALKNKSTRRIKSEMKESDKYYLRYSNFMDIIHLCKLSSFTEVDLADLFNKYRKYFTFYSAEQELIRLEYVDPHPETKIEITNLSNISEYYDLFFGKQKSICARCGKPFIKRHGNQKVCNTCANFLNRDRVARFRSKSKVM